MITNIESKYRVSFSLEELKTLCAFRGNYPQLERKLHVAILKAESGINSPAFISAKKASVLESLDGTTADMSASMREKAYHSYRNAAPGTIFPEYFMLLVHTYMYENDLLDEKQEAEFESTGTLGK